MHEVLTGMDRHWLCLHDAMLQASRRVAVYGHSALPVQRCRFAVFDRFGSFRIIEIWNSDCSSWVFDKTNEETRFFVSFWWNSRRNAILREFHFPFGPYENRGGSRRNNNTGIGYVLVSDLRKNIKALLQVSLDLL